MNPMNPMISMTPERFIELAGAYGAHIGRWPAAHQAAARELQRTAGEAPLAAMTHALAEAAALDGLLARQHVPAPSAALFDRIEASAPRAADVARRPSPGKPRTFKWWPVLGIAGAGMAGMAAGAFAVSFGLTVLQAPSADAWTDSGNAFGVAGQAWGEE